MSLWERWLLGIVSIGAMVMIIPLMVWGGAGSLGRAWEALRQYLIGAAWFCGVVGAVALFAAIGDHGIGALWGMLTGR